MQRTYLQSNVKENKLIRWMDNSFPLKFYIAPFRFYKAQNEGYKYQSLVKRALEAWERASNGRVRFTIVNTLLESQVNLDWKRIDRQALGHCYFNFDNSGRLYSAEVQIGLSDGTIHARYQDENEVYHTILHEIGHALGLGHSPYNSDIMYTPHRYGVINLSENDKYSIQWLYKLPYGSTVDEIARKYCIQANNIDDIIFQLSKKNSPSEFENVKNSIKIQGKDLLEEQQNIAELKKYNIGLQNIQVSSEVQDYIKKNMSMKNRKKPPNKP